MSTKQQKQGIQSVSNTSHCTTFHPRKPFRLKIFQACLVLGALGYFIYTLILMAGLGPKSVPRGIFLGIWSVIYIVGYACAISYYFLVHKKRQRASFEKIEESQQQITGKLQYVKLAILCCEAGCFILSCLLSIIDFFTHTSHESATCIMSGLGSLCSLMLFCLSLATKKLAPQSPEDRIATETAPMLPAVQKLGIFLAIAGMFISLLAWFFPTVPYLGEISGVIMSTGWFLSSMASVVSFVGKGATGNPPEKIDSKIHNLKIENFIAHKQQHIPS